MMGGFLHDMNKKIEQNRKLLKKSGLFSLRESYAQNLKNENIIFQKATKAQLDSIRKKVITQKRQERRRTLKLIVLSSLVTSCIVAILVYWMLQW